ncbi:MAG: YihY family inner membrane protein [Mariprofundaceae bacterium]
MNDSGDAERAGRRSRGKRLLEMDVADIATLPAIKRRSLHLLRLFTRAGRRFVEDRCIQRASALAYATLLAIVPLAALGFTMFASFQSFDVMAANIQQTLLEHLLPTSQEAVQTYLNQMSYNATAMSAFGIIGLLITVTALLNTVEEAFNDIWRISRARRLLAKFTAFWAIITLAPVLIGASISITSYFAALPFLQDVAEGGAAIAKLPFLLPWLMSSLALAVAYTVLPNTRVPFRHAIIGGLISGALFELGKYGFTFYVTNLANYERVYGALATLPIFLIWLYLTWVVVLFGAEIAFCLQHPEQSSKEQMSFLQPGVKTFFAHLILVRAAQAQRHGDMLKSAALLAETGVPENILQEWLDDLCRADLLRRVNESDETWLPAHTPEKLQLFDIHTALSEKMIDIPDAWRQTPIGRKLTGLYYRLEREKRGLLEEVRLADLTNEDEVKT